MAQRFDDWEGEYLAHFRTKGSKNGVRRFQTESGEWTPLGLKERREREGWGDGDRKAEREKKRAARAERIAAYKEQRRQSNLKTMTDDELRKRIERAKLEQEYREITKNPVLRAGANAVKLILDYKAGKEARELERNRQILEKDRIDTQRVQAIEARKKAKFEAKSAKAEAKKMAKDVRGGLKYKRKADLTNAKTAHKGTTIWGALGKAANNLVKYKQELRMNPLEAKKAERTRILQKLQNEKAAQATEQERHKSDQERWKARQKGYTGKW